METIKSEDGSTEVILLDDEDYLWAMEWLISNAQYEDLGWGHRAVERLKKAINQYVEVGLMLDEILGT